MYRRYKIVILFGSDSPIIEHVSRGRYLRLRDIMEEDGIPYDVEVDVSDKGGIACALVVRPFSVTKLYRP